MLNIKFNFGIQIFYTTEHERQWVVDPLAFTMKIHVHGSLPTEFRCSGEGGYCKNTAHSIHGISVQISWKAA